ncbi:MAG: DUF4175 family protein, partial [Balneolaceae bacterium]|nr:DUF4175 family protein [Balneolaceae bacterium]
MDTSVDNNVSDLVRQIERRYRKLRRKQLLTQLLQPLSLVLAGMVLLVWLEDFVYFSALTKSIAGGLLLVAAFSLFRWRKARQEDLSMDRFYELVSDEIEKPELKHALDLTLKSRDSHLKLYKAALRKNLEAVTWNNIQSRIDREIAAFPSSGMFRRTLGALGIAVLVAGLSAVVHPGAFVRTAQFWNTFEKPNPYQFAVLPGNTTIEQGGSFQPAVTFEGPQPEELLLGIKTEVEKEFRFRPLQKAGEGTFESEPVQLSSNATYFIKMGEFSSQNYDVNVQLRPRFESLSVELFPPKYTRLDSSRVTYPFSQVRAYQGSSIRVLGTSNKPLASLTMFAAATGDTLQPDQPGENRFLFERSVSTADTLRFSMQDSSGLSNSNDFSFTIDAVQDEYPFVELIDPAEDVKMSAPAPLDVTFRASDDFGITSAHLHYEIQRAFTQQPETGRLSLGAHRLNVEQTYRWEVPELDPKPRDVITFWITVTDNDAYNGRKQTQSRKLTLTLPSLVENI